VRSPLSYGEVRGSIVSGEKGSKQRFVIQKRSYATKSGPNKLSQVSENKTKNKKENKILTKDFVSLAKH
jgi:hypothetical protein